LLLYRWTTNAPWDKANIAEFKTEVTAYINKFTATPFSTINDMWTSFNILKPLDKHTNRLDLDIPTSEWTPLLGD
jgi:hypothetical protein